MWDQANLNMWDHANAQGLGQYLLANGSAGGNYGGPLGGTLNTGAMAGGQWPFAGGPGSGAGLGDLMLALRGPANPTAAATQGPLAAAATQPIGPAGAGLATSAAPAGPAVTPPTPPQASPQASTALSGAFSSPQAQSVLLRALGR